ncbi:MAG: type VI secretion system contractile sheath large subunit [Desulfobacterales bacterium]|nr:type VI secretion system contractile sheath large subunit [Desulfobacterales bacterium]
MILQTATMGSSAGIQESGLLDKIIEESRVAQSDQEKNRARDIISELVNQVLEGEVVVSENLAASLDARVAELDRLISEQLSEVMHAPEFQALESAWTGLHYLCKQTSTGQQLKIKLFNAAKRDLVRDFRTGHRFRPERPVQEGLRRGVRHLRRSPLRYADRPVRNSRASLKTCTSSTRCAHVAAAAHAPFISFRRRRQLFGLDSYHRPRPAAGYGQGVRYRRVRQVEVLPANPRIHDTRALALPRFLGRLPYNPIDGRS